MVTGLYGYRAKVVSLGTYLALCSPSLPVGSWINMKTCILPPLQLEEGNKGGEEKINRLIKINTSCS